MNSTEKVFSESVEKLVGKGDCKIVAAFSGGCDSLALLALLVNVYTSENIIPCYVNHRIRCNEELEKEIELNRLNCRKLGLELVVKDLGEGAVEKLNEERKGGIEDAARVLRYCALEEVRIQYGCSWIATAHHKDDQIETLVMRMVNNSPALSFRGIPEKNKLVVRPLLDFYKAELEHYLKEKGFTWSSDSTNSDNSITRNRIRNEILPSFRASDPDFDEKMLSVRKQVVSECESFGFDVSDCIDYEWFSGLSGIKKELVIYSCWDEYIKGILPQTFIERVEQIEGNGVVSANGGTVCVYNGKMYFVSEKENPVFDSFECHLEESLLPGNIKLEISDSGNKTDIFFEEGELDGSFRIRFAKTGDKIVLKDGTKMVLKLLQDNKIPSVLRKRVPVLERNGEIAAVFGSVFGGKNRISQRYRTSLAPEKYYKYIIIKR